MERLGRTAALAALAATALAVAGCGGEPARHGGPALPYGETSVMDDQLLLGAPESRIDGVMGYLRKLGVDRVRVSAYWYAIAPRAHSVRKPASFSAADPRSRGYDWSALDRVVESARAHGLKLLVTITTPAPFWASANPGRHDPAWKPRPAAFADFAAAVAQRYAGRVDELSLVNEPNQKSWLSPQVERGRPFSPHWYRRMVEAAYPRMKRAAPHALVLIGELASVGAPAFARERAVAPLTFLRDMACRDPRYRPLRDPRCAGFRAVPADAFAYHPYGFDRPPDRGATHADEALIADTPRLLATLDALVRSGGIDARLGAPLDVLYTEYGYETNPPDACSGVPLRDQDRWLQEAAYMVWQHRDRVRSLNQFRLTDGRLGPGRGCLRFHQFQTGLLFQNARPKPAVAHFPEPFWLVRRGGELELWGQVRPGGAHEVTIERRPPGAAGFQAAKRVRTDAAGYFDVSVPAQPGAWRYRSSAGASAARSAPG